MPLSPLRSMLLSKREKKSGANAFLKPSSGVRVRTLNFSKVLFGVNC